MYTLLECGSVTLLLDVVDDSPRVKVRWSEKGCRDEMTTDRERNGRRAHSSQSKCVFQTCNTSLVIGLSGCCFNCFNRLSEILIQGNGTSKLHDKPFGLHSCRKGVHLVFKSIKLSSSTKVVNFDIQRGQGFSGECKAILI